MVKLVFFGTEKFAAEILAGLIESKKYDIICVVTQPDKPKGRHQQLCSCPVKKLAARHNLHVVQPINLEHEKYCIPPPDLIVVCQYSLIIPKKILAIPKHGALNVHASLLPKYRGASPIQSALVGGEKETGNTIMLMDEKMDHGPILTQDTVIIEPNDTFTTLADKLAKNGKILLLNTIPGFISGKIKPMPQNESLATYTRLLKRENGHLKPEMTAERVYNLFRGLTPWPGVFFEWQNNHIKIIDMIPATFDLLPGELKSRDRHLYWGVRDGAIEIIELQVASHKTQTVKEFISGYHV